MRPGRLLTQLFSTMMCGVLFLFWGGFFFHFNYLRFPNITPCVVPTSRNRIFLTLDWALERAWDRTLMSTPRRLGVRNCRPVRGVYTREKRATKYIKTPPLLGMGFIYDLDFSVLFVTGKA